MRAILFATTDPRLPHLEKGSAANREATRLIERRVLRSEVSVEDGDSARTLCGNCMGDQAPTRTPALTGRVHDHVDEEGVMDVVRNECGPGNKFASGCIAGNRRAVPIVGSWIVRTGGLPAHGLAKSAQQIRGRRVTDPKGDFL